MADDAISPAAASSTPAPASPAAAPAPTPATASPPVVAAETAAPAAASAPESAAASPPVAPASDGSLLGDAKPTEAPKPAEAAAPAPDAPAPAEPAPLPSYESFTLPEGVTLDADKLGELTKFLGEAETAADKHAAMQQLGQQLVDLYVNEMKRASEAQAESWIRTRDSWRNDFIADEAIGGARREQTLANCAQMIEQFGGTLEQQQQLRQAFGVTGMGDHPALIRFINNMAQKLIEPKPVPALNPRSPVAASKSSRRYASSLNGANGAN